MSFTDVAVLGAGPHGLAVAAALRGGGVDHRVIGDPMSFWREMPKGMLLRSNWTATSIADYRGPVSLDAYLRATGQQQWELTLSVDGEERVTRPDVPMLFGIAPFEGIDVGIDRRSPVSWSIYERFGPFPYPGRIDSVTYTPGESAPDAPVNLMDMLREMGSAYE